MSKTDQGHQSCHLMGEDLDQMQTCSVGFPKTVSILRSKWPKYVLMNESFYSCRIKKYDAARWKQDAFRQMNFLSLFFLLMMKPEHPHSTDQQNFTA
jgi:hypothetical protein